jgi:hypothetical protein
VEALSPPGQVRHPGELGQRAHRATSAVRQTGA